MFGDFRSIVYTSIVMRRCVVLAQHLVLWQLETHQAETPRWRHGGRISNASVALLFPSSHFPHRLISWKASRPELKTLLKGEREMGGIGR